MNHTSSGRAYRERGHLVVLRPKHRSAATVCWWLVGNAELIHLDV
jgi:hypothetical protein